MNRAYLGRVLAALIVMISSTGASSGGGACGTAPSALGKYEHTDTGKPAPTVPFYDNRLHERTLGEFRGKALVVNFWATWCAPCVKEMPALDRLSAEIASQGIVVLALSSDHKGASEVEPFFVKNAIKNLPVMIDRMSAVGAALGIRGLPTTVLFDRDGREVGRVAGVADWDAPEAVVFLRSCLAPAA